MTTSLYARVRRRVRPTAARCAHAAAARLGLRVERADTGTLTIPPGRRERFTAGEYEIVPRGAYDIVERNYYSPVPDVAGLPDAIWERRSELGGVGLDVEACMTYVERELAPFVAEFDPPRANPGAAGTFFRGNQNYEDADAELLYAMVRAWRPKRVVELGSGFTTLVIAEACRRNAADGVATTHRAFDPYPRPAILGDPLPAPTVLEPVAATDVPLAVFDELEAGDILFVDTTHTVKIGSDVTFIILDVLPRLAPGVVVHFHDIFLPFEYPRRWFEQDGYLWAEQYLLQAFLEFNDAFEVLVPAQALARDVPERLRHALPQMDPAASPAAFWLRRTASD